MSEHLSESNIKASDWKVEMLRVTAFPVSISKKADPGLWESLLEEAPEAALSRPKEQIYQEEGPLGAGKLILTTHPTRIDWIHSVEPEMSEGFPSLGNFQVSEYDFFSLVKKWLQSIMPIKRLAFGAVLLYPVRSREEGYEKLSHWLPDIPLDGTNSFDFLYQINRPRGIDSPNRRILINRLSKWSVAMLQRVHIGMEIKGQKASSLFPSDSLCACRLELDINTSPQDVDQLPQDDLPVIFDHLVKLAEEIAEKGDIK